MKRKFNYPVRRSPSRTTRRNSRHGVCYLTDAQFTDLVEKFGKEGAAKLKTASESLEVELEKKYKLLSAGNLKQEDFDKFKKEEIKSVNDKIIELEALKDVVEKQGLKINEIVTGPANQKGMSLEEFFTAKVKISKYDKDGKVTGEEEIVLADKMRELYKAGVGVIEISSTDLRKAGVRYFTKVAGNQTVAGSVTDMTSPPGSPYLPGLGGTDLEVFDIVRNPNFIINRVDMGRTNQSRLAWINEVSVLADTVAGTGIAEGATKTLVQHKWKVEMSVAKKAAAYVILSEEFEDDLPNLATRVRRMLQDDVLRSFDDAIQLAVIAAATPYEITGLDGEIEYTTLFDVLGAALAQVGFYNFVPNTLALNTVTSWRVMMEKDSQGRYNIPPFMDRINRLLVEANKVAVNNVLAGDLTQFKVDIYRDFTLRIGWINDQFIKNLFSIVGEIRYHDYISDNRKKAIIYDEMDEIEEAISAGS